ncbi:dinitrogenase iron-molybdenum cofactor [Candidatus Bathyarchaeota archaeon]|nr:dinitrogenase iron-molybdenum cofactor [Candidatus Bathyarchaeota archaeon]
MTTVTYSIATHGNQVAAHFGRCPSYTLIDVENGKASNKRVVQNPGHSTGAIPTYMKELGVDVMIAGGMGRRAIQFFNQFGIQTVLGVNGPIESVIAQIEKGTLHGGESTCSPGGGVNYGIPKADGHHKH